MINGAPNVLSALYIDVCMLSSQNSATPLYIASQNGHSQVAELLLSKGANVNLPMKVQYVSKCNQWYRYSDH